MTGVARVPVVLTASAAITAALSDDRLVPLAMSGTGSVVELRGAMARFSAPTDHADPRAAVISAIESIDIERAVATAAERCARRIDGARPGPIELISSIARPVVAEAVASGLGVPVGELGDVVRDVEAIVAVIGRGAPGSAEADVAADRLSARFVDHPAGAVAAISALYQSMDATAALVATDLIARAARVERVVPIARTIRVAHSATEVDGHPIEIGTTLHLELGAAGMWFGSGPHACPGRSLAERLAESIVAAIELAGATLDVDGIDLDADGRPIAAWLRLDPLSDGCQ